MSPPVPKHFGLALRQLGYVEGQNVAFEYRYGEARSDRFPKLATELVRLNVDMIVVSGGRGQMAAAKNATQTIPIVMVGLGFDPVKAGLVETLPVPAATSPGSPNSRGVLGGKRLELLKEAVPKIVRVAIIYNPVNPTAALEVKENTQLPRALKLAVQHWEVRDADGFRESIRCAKRAALPMGFMCPPAAR